MNTQEPDNNYNQSQTLTNQSTRDYGTLQSPQADVDIDADVDESSLRFNPNTSQRVSLLGWNRFSASFNRRKTSVYVITSTILGIVILVITIAAFFIGFLKVLYPKQPPGHHKPKPEPPTIIPNPEEIFLNYPKITQIKNNLKLITSDAHVAGRNSSYAEWIASKFKEYGLETETITYYPYLNYPRNRSLSILDPQKFKYQAKLREDIIEEDPTSHNPDRVPTFHGYSASGDVTGKLIFANYGRPEDFEKLESKGISITGRLVLVKYGKNFRGLKVMAAQKYGAIGVIVYSDPKEDGFVRGPVYPEGPWRPASGVQRGSVAFLSIHPGDPLTPGYPATYNATRINPENSEALPKIPSLPISYEDALPLLKLLEGHGRKAEKIGDDWQGGLDIDYYSGPSKGHVNLVNQMTAQVSPIYNVFAKIQGTDLKEKAVIVGNHRDAWVYGSTDPGAGTSAILEVARTFGHLLKKGWKPKRTIILATWDGEEYSLLGSTEWCEDKSSWLKENAVAYINVDGFKGRRFGASGTPSLNKFIQAITKKIKDPKYDNRTLFDNWKDQTTINKLSPELGDLGSGSDYTGFYQYLGIPSVNFEFSGDEGVYHSNYDSFNFFEKFGDPEFKSSLAITQLIGLTATKLADSEVLPYHLEDYSKRLRSEIEKIEKTNLKPKLNFKPLHLSLKVLSEKIKQFTDNLNRLGHKNSTHQLNQANDKLAKFEQSLLDPNGLPNRKWYKHIVFAPGLWKGYNSETFPGIREALSENNIKLANELIKNYSNLFELSAKQLEI